LLPNISVAVHQLRIQIISQTTLTSDDIISINLEPGSVQATVEMARANLAFVVCDLVQDLRLFITSQASSVFANSNCTVSDDSGVVLVVSTSPAPSSSSNTSLTVGLSVSMVLLFVLICLILVYVYWRSSKRKQLRVYPSTNLVHQTSSLSQDRILVQSRASSAHMPAISRGPFSTA
jgi:hypothetical protein